MAAWVTTVLVKVLIGIVTEMNILAEIHRIYWQSGDLNVVLWARLPDFTLRSVYSSARGNGLASQLPLQRERRRTCAQGLQVTDDIPFLRSPIQLSPVCVSAWIPTSLNATGLCDPCRRRLSVSFLLGLLPDQ